VLRGNERAMVQVLKKHGPIMDRSAFEAQCVRRGMNRFSFNAVAANSCVVLPYGRSLYGLAGGAADRSAVARIQAGRAPRSPSPVLTAYGRTSAGRNYMAYRVSRGVLSTGVVTVPAAFQSEVCGEFALLRSGRAEAHPLMCRKACAWGLGPALRALKAQEGDCLLLLVDCTQRQVEMHLGDTSVLKLIEQ
jgi:hypothetical protein